MLKLFGGGKPDHPLADAKEARRLLDALPADDAYKALEELAHWMDSTAAAEGFRPLDRIQTLYMVDEAAQPRLRKLARDYAAATRPSRFTENRIWSAVHGYWKSAGLAYARSIDMFVQNAKATDAAKAQLPGLIARALRSFGQQLKWMHLRYGPMDLAVWGVVNNVYAFAEARGLAQAACTPYPGGGETTPQREFLKLAFFTASSPDSLLPVEAEFAERVINELSPRLTQGASRGGEHGFWIDLGQPLPPQRVLRAPPASPGLRFLGAAAAREELESRIAGIRSAGRAPAEMLQGAINETEAVLDVLGHLAMHWSGTPPERRFQRHAVKSRLSVTHGFDTVLGVLGQSPDDTLDFQAREIENWVVENVSAGGFGAIVPQLKGDWLKVGALLALQPDGGSNWLLGMVRRVNKTGAQQARIGIQTLAKAPRAERFEVAGAFGAAEPGVLLRSADAESGDALIALKPGVFAPGQNLELDRGERQHVFMPQALAEKAEDFEIGRFREMIREL
ncbi:MAG: hypothetical protein AB7O31_13695 [Burkholderiales bacterium]